MWWLTAGCTDPASDVARREAPWWGDAAALEAVAGLDLVEVPAAEPVGYWPRIVVTPDRLAVDDRAWWLSIDPALRDDAWLVDVPEVGGLVGGRLPDPERMLIPTLLDVLEDVTDALRAADARGVDLRPWPSVLVVPDPAVPAETLAAVLVTAGMAQFSSYGLGVASRGRVRNVLVDEPDCPTRLTLALGAAGAVLLPENAPPLLPPGGACPARPEAAVDAALHLAAACGPVWDTLADGGREGWRCLDVGVGFGDTDTDTVLRTASRLLEDPDDALVLGAPTRVPEPPSCAHAVPVDALTPAQLEVVCHGAALASWLADPEPRWAGLRVRIREGRDPRAEVAFPGWSAAREGLP